MVHVNPFIISLKCSWIKRLTSCACNSSKPWMEMFFALNDKNFLVHLYDFGDTFVQQYMLNRNNASWKDVLESWLYFMKVYDKQENFRNNYIVFLFGIIQISKLVLNLYFLNLVWKTGKGRTRFLDENGNFFMQWCISATVLSWWFLYHEIQ